MTRRRAPPEDVRAPDAEPPEDDHGIGLVGAAVHAPLSQGRDGSFPLELDGDDLTEPPDERRDRVRGEPTEPALHSPTAAHVEPLPVATGECTVDVIGGESPCEEEEDA